MWSGSGPPGMYGSSAPAAQQQSQQKHDIFVGNLAFHTTEDQLHQAFSEIGRVIKVRLVTDSDTGKPRGFAFVEFEDPQAALSAIRNMNDYELNGRRLRVNFSNSSHLEALAGKLGMDLSQQTAQRNQSNRNNDNQQQSSGAGTQQVSDALKGMSKGEMYDVVAKLKEIADRDQDEARRIIAGHPQLPEAILFLMSKLDMVRDNPTPMAVVHPPAAAAPPQRAMDPRARVSDPRAAKPAAAAPPPPRADPRARLDPRARAAAGQPPPPMMAQPPPPPQPYNMPPPPGGGVANLDPSLVQQVMSLTPHQISQLPPDKQQSILALRQQISGGR
ncbi:stimulation factor subunit 2 tau variant [Seminavis robusta]|uniref:Stimulation factor subunit 2 tau variant n=1 Tax=Seminavis robusta TaxID=568900 RepID=A0A9N8EQ79_9STRA|nr:stimulation factor subunit 2 tau variant [Seminavis robusta]|eukprot:Sro1655_g289020.1 stimulation factor subunit 2 tau variant (331) ;mRNA; r:20553-21645